MKITTPVNDVPVERKRGTENFKLVVEFIDGDQGYSSEMTLWQLLDDDDYEGHSLDRQDITQKIIQKAVDAWFENTDYDIDVVRNIEIQSHQPLRKTPYDDRADFPE